MSGGLKLNKSLKEFIWEEMVAVASAEKPQNVIRFYCIVHAVMVGEI
jgi:hypothetical protein